MKKMMIVAAALSFFAFVSLSQAASVENGKLLFESPAFGGGTSGKSCKTCHPGGKNLGSKLFDKERTSFTIMGIGKKSLAEVVNVCIEKPLAGTAIDPDGEEMADIIAYMQKMVKGKRKKAIAGC